MSNDVYGATVILIVAGTILGTVPHATSTAAVRRIGCPTQHD